MFYELADLGFIKIEGQDAKKFLQGQLTCDVDSITNSYSSLGAHCNPQGRIISLFYICMWQNAYYLLLPKTMIHIALGALKKYAVFFKVQLTESQEIIAIGCNDSIPPHIFEKIFCHIPLPHSPRSILICEQHLRKEIADINTSYETWNLLNIKENHPSIFPETSGKFLPHELNLDKLGGINFEKGCYTGQEIIARMHYRGKSKNQLYQAHVTSLVMPQPGADIYVFSEEAQKPAGMIVATTKEEYNNYHMLIITNELNSNSPSLFLNQDKTSPLSIQLRSE